MDIVVESGAISLVQNPVITKDEEDTTLEELFKQGEETDPVPNEVLRALRNDYCQSKFLSLAECKEQDG